MLAPTQQGLDRWRFRRRRLRRWWWGYLVVSMAGLIAFVKSSETHDPYLFAVLLSIPLIGLRQAWRVDRQIVECEKHIREPIIDR